MDSTKSTYTGIANFDDEIGELEAAADGASCGGHVTGEPIDRSGFFSEAHPADQSLLRYLLRHHFLRRRLASVRERGFLRFLAVMCL